MKYLLIVILAFISIDIFAQSEETILSVPDSLTPFKIPWFKGGYVKDTTSKKLWQLKQTCAGTKTLATSAKYQINLGGGSVTPEITVSAADVSNGYIIVPTITLDATKTKVIRGGAIQDNSMYTLNNPASGQISFTSPLLEGEVIKVFN